ncbi:MAG: hypothetical protein V1789_12845 [PVC group bacterium]
MSDRKLIEVPFDNEQEIEDVVLTNFEHFFGPSSILIPKAKIKTKDGFGTIPDGFAIDLASRSWYVVEVELLRHNVWTHIAPQVSKQLIAVRRPDTGKLLSEIIVEMIAESEEIKEKFHDEGIREINIRKVLGEIFAKPPIIGMPIDAVSDDLREWAETLKNDSRLWIVRKFIEYGKPEVVAYDIPEEFRPAVDTTEQDASRKAGLKYYDVRIADLIEAGLLTPGEELIHSYKPRGAQRRMDTARVGKDGKLEVLGEKFSSPSYAALYCINAAGSSRRTVNGWTSWKAKSGKILAQLRSAYLSQKEKEAEQE